MRVAVLVINLAAVVLAAQAVYSAPVDAPDWFGQPAINTSPPPHWIPKRLGHYTLTDWQHVIDSTWGPGLPLEQKLAVFDSFWNTIDDSFPCFNNLSVNWDSLRTVYRSEIQDTVSRGRFAAIMSHLAMALREAHTNIVDEGVSNSQLLPGVPLWVVGAWAYDIHFGAGLTPLPDSSLLVYRAANSHPLGLEPGDVVLGYDRRRWVDILQELQQAQLPISTQYCWGSCSSAMAHSLLNAAGANWHLFDTIDIVQYSTGDTVHLPTSLMVGHAFSLVETDQLSIPGVPMPYAGGEPSVTCGIVSGTRIGYIYGWRWSGNAGHQFYKAVDSLVSNSWLKGIIVDFRFNQGGNLWLSDSGLNLLFRDSTKTIEFRHRSDADDHFALRVSTPASAYVIPGNGVGYDKPIAVLVGPASVSSGDQVAFRMTFHPRVKTFGKSTNAAFNAPVALDVPSEWWARYAVGEACLASDTTCFLTHREFPVDVPVWHTRDAVSRGEDTVVTAAMAWIDSTAGVDEEALSAEAQTPNAATIVHGVLLITPIGAQSGFPGNPITSSAALLDISGRKVMGLRPGANDVRALAPGVYFVRTAQAQAQARAVRKVIITK